MKEEKKRKITKTETHHEQSEAANSDLNVTECSDNHS